MIKFFEMQLIKTILILLLAVGVMTPAQAHINPDMKKKPKASNEQMTRYRSDCNQSTQQIDQAINNVRARLLNGGDVWWDGGDGRYIVPKVEPGLPEVSALFAGAVWLGGVDDGDNLKLAAQTYGTASGDSDFWPGPLSEVGTTSQDTCDQWDRFWTVTAEEIEEHLRNYDAAILAGEEYDDALIPRGVKEWPGRGNRFFFELNQFELPFTLAGLGSFFDANGNGTYEPQEGEYPDIDIRGCEAGIYPDEMIFWIYNDAGNVHSESNGDAIRMEVQVQAFAYATNDEINDMTFQRYKLINRAVESIDSTFFAMWVDPDLGCFTDDYIGCDIGRSLAYVYNQDALDGESGCDCTGGVNTYCADIPLIGVDYFRGPRAPKIFNPDGSLGDPDIGQEPDTIVELGMSSFTYYNNGGGNPTPPPGTTDPGVAQEYYNYLTGSWLDGTPFTFDGDGYNLGSTDFINYAFPDPPNDATGWNMCTSNLSSGDRRTIQASGPFRLDPGATNELIIGVPFVPSILHPCPNISKLLSADDIAQSLFDECFKLPNGPDAPNVDWIELDREIVAVFTNEPNSNNFKEEFTEAGLGIPDEILEPDNQYVFEGYKLYQLRNSTVSFTDLDNDAQARLVAQVDIKNGINTLYNWTSEENPLDPSTAIWSPNEEVRGADDGIRHTIRITEDLFSDGDRRLVNHKKYYYIAIAYAYNEYEEFDPFPPISGQRTPYLEGRRNIGDRENGGAAYVAVPRPITAQIVQSQYGDGPVITRLDGAGAGEQFLSVSKEMREAIVDNEHGGEITYLPGQGPLDIRVYNPLQIQDGTYELRFFDADQNSDENFDAPIVWEVTNNSTGEVIQAERDIDRLNEQILADFGFTVSIRQSNGPGDFTDPVNGVIGGAANYDDINGSQWFSFVEDQAIPFNYVKTDGGERDENLDPGTHLSTIMDGMFVPYVLCDWKPQEGGQPFFTPAWVNSSSEIVRQRNPLDSLNNVDIVFTSDKSKWSRCVVVETANAFYYSETSGFGIPTENDTRTMDPRLGQSVDQNGNPDGSGTGFGWFPGYAIDVETGQRLNIFFGENSAYACVDEVFAALEGTGTNIDDCSAFENGVATGRDMIWNPSSQFTIGDNFQNIFAGIGGAQHYIYVTRQPYDECAEIAELLGGSSFQKVRALSEITWTAWPILATGEELLSVEDGLIPNDYTVELRVDRPYRRSFGTQDNASAPLYNFTFEGTEARDVASQEEIDSELDAINVVPNPYYGFSSYEISQFSNVVKITNLPARSTVTIYTLDGKFIREYRRDLTPDVTDDRVNPGINVGQVEPSVEWDLRNSAGIPVSSGVYLIHVNAPGKGERVIKWFGVQRQFDPTGL